MLLEHELHREGLYACVELLIAHVVGCLTWNQVYVQLGDRVEDGLLRKLIRRLVLLVSHVLNYGRRRHTLCAVSLMDSLGELLDCQGQIE